MTKAELMYLAQALCEASFVTPEAGSRYTAWSTMSSLIKKELVVKTNSPARYSLTEIGHELAEKLEAAEQDPSISALDSDEDSDSYPGHRPTASNASKGINQKKPSASSTSGEARTCSKCGSTSHLTQRSKHCPFNPKNQAAAEDGDDDDNSRDSGVAAQGSHTHSRAPSAYSSLPAGAARSTVLTLPGSCSAAHHSGSAAIQRAKAAAHRGPAAEPTVHRHGKQPMGGAAGRNSPSADKKDLKVCDNCEQADATLQCQECSELLCDECNYYTHRSEKKKAHKRRFLCESDFQHTDARGLGQPAAVRQASQNIKSRPSPELHAVAHAAAKCSTPALSRVSSHGAAEASVFSPMFSPVDGDEGLSMLKRISTECRSSTAPDSKATSSKAMDKFKQPDLFASGTGTRNTGHSEGSAASITSAASSREVTSDMARRTAAHTGQSFALTPGNYEIVLGIDTMEQTGSRKDKGVIQTKLTSMGVKTTVRTLALGDFVWFAQERVQPLPGQLALPPRRELILDYVIERKRMDDLAGSITDGRFEEQKYRFRSAGIKHGVYLVEDHGRIENKRLPAATLKQAMANSQVFDGFFVKHTADTTSTIAYLVLMTRKIEDIFEGTTVIAKGVGDDRLSQQYPDHQILNTFEDYVALTLKTKTLTVREMFARQLMQLVSLTAPKAKAVVDLYPSPVRLMKAYDKCADTAAAEKMLADVKYLVGLGGQTKPLGMILSQTIARLYQSDILLP